MGAYGTRLTITLGELEHIESEIERILAPFVLRGHEGALPGARSVRMMRYVMPEARPRAGEERASAMTEAAAPPTEGSHS